MENLSIVEFIPDPASEKSTLRYNKLKSEFDLIYMANCSKSQKKLSIHENSDILRGIDFGGRKLYERSLK